MLISTRPFRTNTKKHVIFIIRDWNAKVGSQEIPGVTDKFGLGVQNESGQRLTGFCQKNALVIANTLFQQHKRQLYTWTSPDGQYWNHSIIFCDYIILSYYLYYYMSLISINIISALLYYNLRIIIILDYILCSQRWRSSI